MIARFRQLKANAGWGGVIKTVLLLTLSLAVLVGDPEPPYSRPALLAALLLPYFLKGVMAAYPERSSRIIKYFGLAIVALAAVGQNFMDAEVVGTLTTLFGVLALYISVFFWFWSDSRIEVVKS